MYDAGGGASRCSIIEVTCGQLSVDHARRRSFPPLRARFPHKSTVVVHRGCGEVLHGFVSRSPSVETQQCPERRLNGVVDLPQQQLELGMGDVLDSDAPSQEDRTVAIDAESTPPQLFVLSK